MSKLLAWFGIGMFGLLFFPLTGGAQKPEIMAVSFRTDIAFPEYIPLWYEGWGWKDDTGASIQYAQPGMPVGGTIHVFLRNMSEKEIKLSDVLIDGVSLSKAVVAPEGTKEDKHASSLKFSKLPPMDIKRLRDAGEPVWWKIDPMTVEPRQTAEVTIRMRREPSMDRLNLKVLYDSGEMERVLNTREKTPRIEDISFSPDLKTVTLYLRQSQSVWIEPIRILMDGVDVTARCKFEGDSHVDTVPVILQLPTPLEKGSYHCFQASFEYGPAAVAGIRAWSEDLVYGMWGYKNMGATPEESGKNFISDLLKHNINVLMGMVAGLSGEFIHSREGFEYCDSVGMRMMATWFGNARNPIYYFLLDEPDAHDFAYDDCGEPPARLGCLAQCLVAKSQVFREKDPATMQLLNINNTYKPDNWYTYAQLADVCCADPYYQEQLCVLTSQCPSKLVHFTKPTYVQAVGKIARSACAPKPLHLILNSVRHEDIEGPPYRFGTPEEKRLELYYALGAGTKGFSYWWYTPYGRFHGCGSSDPDGVALYNEIARLGAEVRTAAPLILRSCPAKVETEKPKNLSIFPLLAGNDSLVLLFVNEQLCSDRLGTVVVDLENVNSSVRIPSWIEPVDVFEVSSDGISDVTWAYQEPKVELDLGTVSLTRMLIVTQNQETRQQLASLYKEHFEDNIKALPEVNLPVQP